MLSYRLLAAVSLAVSAQASQLLDKNLAYRSPFVGYDDVSSLSLICITYFTRITQFSLNTRAIEARHIAHAKRQVISAGGFDDEHYPTFYGGDFSNVSYLAVCIAESQLISITPRVLSCGTVVSTSLMLVCNILYFRHDLSVLR